MKKVFLFVMLISSILAYAAVIEQTYYFNDLEISQTDNHQTVEFENTQQAGITGEPALPYRAVQLLLPPGEIASRITLIPEEKVILSEQLSIYPMQSSKPLSNKEPAVFKKNESLYSSSEVYPLNKHGRLTTEFLNGFGFALSTITPVNYIPAKKELSYYKRITVRIETSPNPEAAEQARMVSSRSSVLAKIESFSQNSRMMASYNSISSRDDEYEVLIISPAQFENDFDEWIYLNNKKGLRSEFASMENITSSMTGQDPQEKIRNYIIQEYTDNDVLFVLLGGDVELVPPRGFYCYCYSFIIRQFFLRRNIVYRCDR